MATISLSENLITLAEAAKHLPGRPHKATIWRWATGGVRGGILLESILSGGVRYTSTEALDRFIKATTEAANRRHAPKRTRRDRQRAIEAAERQLDAAGL